MFFDDPGVASLERSPTIAEEDESSTERARFCRVVVLSLVGILGLVGLVVVARLRAPRLRGERARGRRPRFLLTRTALSTIDLKRRPPRGDASPGSLRDAFRAFRRPPAPRTLPYVTLKRINPRLGDTFGHWWLEVDDTESYGWWPDRCPLRVRDFFFGASGTVNGLDGSCRGGTTMTDPHHGEPAQHSVHPTLIARKSDRQVRSDIRAFARSFTGEWRYSTKPTSNDCRSFQMQLLHAVGLEESPEDRHTRGRGCPFLSLFRPRVREFATETVRG
jgi:hypothetical protein